MAFLYFNLLICKDLNHSVINSTLLGAVAQFIHYVLEIFYFESSASWKYKPLDYINMLYLIPTGMLVLVLVLVKAELVLLEKSTTASESIDVPATKKIN